MPDPFGGCELSSVHTRILKAKSRPRDQHIAPEFVVVNLCVVPHNDYVTAQILEQTREEIVRFLLRYALGVYAKVQTETTLRGAYLQSADRNLQTAAIAVANRCFFPTDPPTYANWRDQHEARFIGKDFLGEAEVSTQARSASFTCGDRLRFHSLLFFSSRSRTRRSGFGQLELRSCRRITT
jgi:hypothetical protein